MCAFAVGGYFPDINETPEFRIALEDALEHQSITFDASDGAIHHHYLISYGPGYLQEHAMRIFDAEKYREAHALADSATATPVRLLQGPHGRSYVDTFKQFLHHHVLYQEEAPTHAPAPEETDMTDHSKSYTVRIRIPGRANPDHPPVFSFALVDVSDLPPLDPQWVTATGDIALKHQLRIRQLLKNFIYGEHQASTTIGEAKERHRALTDEIRHIEQGIRPNTDLDFVRFNSQIQDRVAAGHEEEVQEEIRRHPDKELILLNALLERFSTSPYRLELAVRSELHQIFPAQVNRETLPAILRHLNPNAADDISYLVKIIPVDMIFDLTSLTTTLHLVELNKERADLAVLIQELICPREILAKFYYPNIVTYIREQDESIPETLIARMLEKMGLFTVSNLQALLGSQ
jgi:hypothetical protein